MGRRLRRRAPTPADYPHLKAFYDGLSADSRYLRFHGQGRSDVAAEAEIQSGVDRQALIACYRDRVVAVASFDGLRQPRVAKVSFA